MLIGGNFVALLMVLSCAGTITEAQTRCQNPSGISHGTVKTSDESYSVNTVVTYKCLKNYQLHGNSQRTCQNNGHWSGCEPQCDDGKNVASKCQSPNTPAHGNVRTSDSTYKVDTVISYECDKNYQLQGNSQRTCQRNGRWSGCEPRCEDMKTRDVSEDDCRRHLNQGCHQHAHCKREQNNYRCICQSGYTGDGFRCEKERPKDECHKKFHRGCHENGYCHRISEGNYECKCSTGFSGNGFYCQSVVCQKPGGIPNGRILTNQNKYVPGNVLSYQCDQHYKMKGRPQRKCKDDGQWTGREPRCEAVRARWCLAPKGVSHATISPSKKKYRIKSKVTYKCAKGYRISGSSQRTCQVTGQWSGTDPRCEPPNRCDRACHQHAVCREIQAGKYQCVCRGSFTGDGINCWKRPIDECEKQHHHACHRLADCERISDGKFKCKCREGYTGDGFSCQDKGCQRPMDIPNGKILSTQKQYVRGNSITYQCDSGFKMTGKAQRICMEHGGWSPSEPRCEEVSREPTVKKCQKPRDIPNGKVNIGDGRFLVYTVITYECTQPYRLDGDSHRTCQKDGQWSRREPHCRMPNECEKKGSACHQNADCVYKDGKHGCACRDPYRGDGHNCEDTRCRRPNDIQNGKILTTQLFFIKGNEISYQCDHGYKLNGKSKRKCLENRQWSETEPRCEA